jgi:hypothetical protein
MIIKKDIFIILIFSLLCATAKAQRSEIFVSNIASLQVIPNDDNWQEPLPVIDLTSADDHVVIAFDELSHDYHRYTYTVQHCEADWTPSEELLESDYIDGFRFRAIPSTTMNNRSTQTRFTLIID